MISPSRDLQTKKDALFAVLENAEYGTLFPHAALTEIVGEPSITNRYYRLVTAVSKRLEREAFRTLRPQRGEGYCVARPNQHTELAHARHLKALRQKRRGVEILRATHVPSLTPAEHKRHDERLRLEQHHLSILRQIKHRVEVSHRETEKFIEDKLEAAIARIEQLERRGA